MNRNFLAKKTSHFFYDEDFHLFVEFPFHQMVYFKSDSFDRKINKMRQDKPFTCTELWLFQYYRQLNNANEFTEKILNSSNFTAYDLQKRVNLCRKGHF